MGVITPSSALEVLQKILQDVKGALPTTNPWLNSSLIKSNPIGLANRIYDYYFVMRQGIKESFPFEATGEYLQFWATLKKMLPYTSHESDGPVTWTGTLGSTVTAGSIWKVGTLEYSVDLSVNVEENSRIVVSLTADGLTGVCVTSGNHNLHDDMDVVISGVNQSEWNNTWSNISVVSATRFQFDIPAGMPTPATGKLMLVTFLGALGNVTSVEKGDDLNQTGNTELEADTTLTGIDDIAGVQFEGLTNGRDDETRDEYSARIIERYQKPQTPSNPNKIEAVVKAIPGNTRVWIHRVTPKIGAVTVFFVRDNDDTIIPDSTSVLETKEAVFDSFGAQTDYENVHVNDPLTGIEINSVIVDIQPATTSMRAAVKASIRTYFRGSIAEGQDFDPDKLKSAIDQTYDSVRGEKITDFDMDSPLVGSAVAIGEIAIEGSTTAN